MKILTWNINSVRLRIDLLLDLLVREQPDVVCLQETKCPNDKFPFSVLKNAGYANIYISGMKGYNGVAILSKLPFEKSETVNHCSYDNSRHVFVGIKEHNSSSLIYIHSVYVPAGGDLPDPDLNDKFRHKLSFVDSLSDWFSSNINADNDKIIIAGDFNIAPMEHDVWSHKQLLNVVSHTPIEVEKLNSMQSSMSWHDAIRHFVPENEKLYTWWSYRNRDWKKSNRGRRLDHIWVSQKLKTDLRDYKILKNFRDAEKPSDHVPVMIVL